MIPYNTDYISNINLKFTSAGIKKILGKKIFLANWTRGRKCFNYKCLDAMFAFTLVVFSKV